MAVKAGKAAKRKKKLSAEVQEEVRFLKLAIDNHERCALTASGELKTYFERRMEINRAKLRQLTSDA